MVGIGCLWTQRSGGLGRQPFEGLHCVLRDRAHRLVKVICVATLSVAALVFGNGEAFGARAHVYGSSFGGAGAAPGSFATPTAVAIDESSGDIYVLDRGNGRVERFSASGAYVSQFAVPSTTEGPPVNNAIAVDNAPGSASAGDVYVIDTVHHVIEKFDSAGVLIATISESSSGAFGALFGVAVDSTGKLWVYQENEQIDSFNNATVNEPLGSVMSPFGTYPGFAVDSEDNLYVNRGAEVVAKLTSWGSPLIEELDAERTDAAAVDMKTNDAYIDNISNIARFSASGGLIERIGGGRLQEGGGVAVNARSGAVYVADSAANEVDVFELEPPAAPTIDGESSSSVTTKAATLEAEINPHGTATTYRFEYECEGSFVGVAEGTTGAGFEDERVHFRLNGLVAGLAYRYRVTATNAHGSVTGPERSFTTARTGISALPDGRAWELVSPAEKQGAELESLPLEGGLIEASEAGSAFTYLARSPIAVEAAGNGGELTQALARRVGPGRWESQDIEAPDQGVNGENSGRGNEYRFFSSDLSTALVEQQGYDETPLSESPTQERTMYRRDNGTGAFTPVVSAANVPPGTKYGIPFGSDSFISATPDLRHVVFASSAPLTSAAASGQNLYEWNEGAIQLVSVLPNGSAGSPAVLGEHSSNVRNAISKGGSRIIWTRFKGESESHLYLRDTQKGDTLQIDAGEMGAEAATGEATFELANAEGTRVFFADGQRLTAESRAEGPGRRDLYECEVVEVAGKLTCKLTDLTVPINAGESASLQGLVIGASQDGSFVYFVTKGALTEGVAAGECEGTGSTCNLYMWHDGVVRFIAPLSPADKPVWADEGSLGRLTHVTSRVSPDGRYLTFMSQRPLSGYDNTDLNSGQADEEVYLYDASRPTSSSNPTCVSCNPTGARPAGVFDSPNARSELLVDRHQAWAGAWLAGSIPAWTPTDANDATYQSRFLLDSGRLFFDSADALVPQDTNGKEDVYEYEPVGVGACTQVSTTYTAASNGCVSLLSSGTSSEESAFLDATPSGEDVFFLTSSRLVEQDLDSSFDVYDARVCGDDCPAVASGGASCNSSESCRPPATPQPPGLAPAGSATPSGNGNLAPESVSRSAHPARRQLLSAALRKCRKKPRWRRIACERRARRMYGPTHVRHPRHHLHAPARKKGGVR